MIKKFIFCFSVLCLAACGPSQEELEKQQRIEDSLMEIERIDIIAKANQNLMEDTIDADSLNNDTVIKE